MSASFSNAGSLESTLLQPRQPLRCRSGTHPPTPTPAYLAAIDNLSTKLRIPFSAVEKTLALEDDGLVPGLCRLHMEGRCRQGHQCYQVHASRPVIEQLRQEALRSPSCCHEHGAACNFEGFPLGLTITIEPSHSAIAAVTAMESSKATQDVGSNADASSSGETGSNGLESPSPRMTLVSLHRLSPTNCLWSMYKANGNTHLTAPRSRICREHRKGLCRFGDECSFLHICREIQLDRPPVFVDDDPVTPLTRPGRNDRYSSHHGSYNSATQHAPVKYLLLTPGFPASYHLGHSASDSYVGSLGATCVQQSTSQLSNGAQPLTDGGRLLRPLGSGHSVELPTPHRANSFSHNPYADGLNY